MKRTIATGLLAATLATGCGEVPQDTIELEVVKHVYPFDPEKAGPKGSGNLGTVDKPLGVGMRVVADCVKRSEHDRTGIGDSVKLGGDEYRGLYAPLLITPVEQNDTVIPAPVQVFDKSAKEIIRLVGFC